MRHYFRIVLVIVISSTLYTVGAIFEHKIDQQHAFSEFESIAKEYVWLVDNEIDHILSTLQAFTTLYANQQTIQSEDFTAFAQPLLLHHPVISDLAWVPRVTKAQHPKTEYFPVYYQASLAKHKNKLIGFDLGSILLTTLNKARDTNSAQISAGIYLGNDNNQQTIIAVYPIYQSKAKINTVEKRRQFLKGFVIETIQLSDLIDEVLKHYRKTHPQNVNIVIHDNTFSLKKQLLYGNNVDNTALTLTIPLKVTDRNWLITCSANKNDYLQLNRWLPINTLLLILLITVSVSIYLFKSIRYRHTLQERKSHKRFTTLLDSLDSAVYVIDMQSYEILFVNRYVQEQFHKHYLLGSICWQTLQPNQTGPCSFCTNEKLVSPSGQPTGIHCWEYQRSKSQRWFYMQDQAITWDNEKLVRLSVGTDITERKQAEIAMQLSESRLLSIQKIAKIGYWEWHLDSDRVTGSEEFFEQFYLSIEDNGRLPIANFLQTIHSDDRKYVKQEIKRALHSHQSYHTEFRVVHFKGITRHLRAFGSVTYDEKDIPIYFIGSTQDVTEEKCAEIALRQSKKLLQDIVDNTNILVFVKDLQGRYILTNKSHNEILNLTQEEVLGKTDYHIHPKLVADKITEKDFYVLAFAKMLTTEENLKLHLKEYTFITSKIPLFDENGEVYAVCGVAVDITERKKMEEMLKERESKLQLAKEAAESANHAKSTFLANMSHELRTPLNGILGYAQLFGHDTTLDEQQQEGVQIIQRCGEHLLTLINDILDLSKIEAGKLELMPKEFRFTEFLKEIVDLFKMRAAQKGIHFFCQQIPPPVFVQGKTQEGFPNIIYADEKRLRQILLNLVSNAIKFTDAGEVFFKVIYHDNCIRFDIEDTGCGISFEKLKNIFVSFQPLGEKSRQMEGAGLGLSISSKLVKLMGGKLQVESLVGTGSLFWFEIPLDVVQYNTDLSLEYSMQQKIVGFYGKQRKILLIDDYIENTKLLTNFLTPLHFQVKSCQTGQAGLEIANTWHPDAILVDLVMPQMDGFEFTRRFRASPNGQQTIIISISASAFDFHQTKSLLAGCNHFIAKPINLTELLHVLQKYLQLEWTYQMEVPIVEKVIDHSLSEMKLPTPNQIEYLLELAMQGDIQTIKEELDDLSKKDTELLPFIKHAQQLANHFKTKQLCEFIKQVKVNLA